MGEQEDTVWVNAFGSAGNGGLVMTLRRPSGYGMMRSPRFPLTPDLLKVFLDVDDTRPSDAST